MSGGVTRTDRDGVAELRLERPESRNAVNTELLLGLREHLQAIQDDASTRAVIVAAAGPAFCAGADVREFPPDAPPQGPLRRIRLVTEVLRRFGELEQPTLAAVHGPAVGAGWGVALACDVCYATADATFSLPELAKGFRIPELLMRRLVDVVGPVRAAELAFTGRRLPAGEAATAGCVARVFSDRDGLLAAARELASTLAAQPRRSVATAKQPLRGRGPHVPFPPPELIWTEDRA
jgi:enoyl-CoA hydratase/carnithine racemase